MRLIYDPDSAIGYGRWTCATCNADFYGGGRALHERGCAVAKDEYESCDYNFSLKEVITAIEFAAEHGRDDYRIPLGPLSLACLIAAGYGKLVEETRARLPERTANRCTIQMTMDYWLLTGDGYLKLPEPPTAVNLLAWPGGGQPTAANRDTWLNTLGFYEDGGQWRSTRWPGVTFTFPPIPASQ